MHWVFVTFVVCQPVVKGGVIFSVKKAASTRKNRWKESGAFFCNVVLMVKSDRWNMNGVFVSFERACLW